VAEGEEQLGSDLGVAILTGVGPFGSRRTWVVGLLLVVALLLRLAYVDATPGYFLRHDARDYDKHARSIAVGEGYRPILAPERATAFRPPGYPVALAVVYRVTGVERAPVAERLGPARVAQAVVGTLVVALIGALGAQLWGWRVGLIALALGAVYLPLVLVGGAVMSEPLFVALLLGALVAALHHRRSRRRLRWVVVAGGLAGLAILTRANALVLLAPLALAAWDGRPRWSPRALVPPAVLVAVALLTVAPWTIRNAVVFDSFVPVSTQLGSAMAGTYNDQARLDRADPASWRSLRRVPEYARLYRELGQASEAEVDRRLRAASRSYIADHPSYVAAVAWWSTRRMLDLAGWDRSLATAATITVEPGWAAAGVVCFWLFAVLALGGAATRRARHTPLLVWMVPALLFLSVVFLVVETPRYRTAIDPFVVLLAALALASVADRRGRARRGPAT